MGMNPFAGGPGGMGGDGPEGPGIVDGGMMDEPDGRPGRAPVNPFVQGFMLGMQAGIQQAKGELGGGPPPMGMFGSGDPSGPPMSSPSAPSPAPGSPGPSMISPFLQR